jgi:TRAP-type C4-dicarboxylate transport system permease small subunit
MSSPPIDQQVLHSSEAKEEGLAAPQLSANSWGGSWLNVRLPQLLRDIAAFLFLPLIVVVIGVDVVGRYFFNHPFQWSQELAALALLLLFVAAIPFTTAADGHVRTETLYENYSLRKRSLVDAVSAMCGAIFMSVIAIWQLRELPGLYLRGEGAEFIQISYWPISLFVALCMLFGALQLLVQMAEKARDFLRPGDPS